MRATGTMTRGMGKGMSDFLMGTPMKETSETARLMGGASTLGRMGRSMTDNGSMG